MQKIAKYFLFQFLQTTKNKKPKKIYLEAIIDIHTKIKENDGNLRLFNVHYMVKLLMKIKD